MIMIMIILFRQDSVTQLKAAFPDGLGSIPVTVPGR